MVVEILEKRITELKTKNIELESRNIQLEAELKWLKDQFKLAQKRQFGSSSEKSSALLQIEMLFNEVEATADASVAEPEPQTITYTRKPKSVGHKQEVIADLPIEVIEYKLPEDEQVCSCCGGPMHEMSTSVREELEIIPAQARIIKYVRSIYSCRHCELNEINTPIVAAPAPKPLISKSLASASAVSYIMGLKYVEAMPIYRQEQHFERLGIDLSRATLSNWVIKGGKILEPICDRMHEVLIGRKILHADETTVQVLHEDGREAQSKSYIWLYRTGRDGPPIVLYDYQQTREGKHPKQFLQGFGGHLHVDGWAGYHNIEGVSLNGCWAHVRRKFVDALEVIPKDKRSDPKLLANEALACIGKMYGIEAKIKDFSPEEQKAYRDENTQPILDKFKIWLDREKNLTLPKSILGTAITYTLNQWPKLINFMKDGRCDIDNNRAERSIKPFVIGRKNWLFANTPRGAQTSAIIYSIVETAKENGLNPFEYIKYLLQQIPNIDMNDKNAVDNLLPWNT